MLDVSILEQKLFSRMQLNSCQPNFTSAYIIATFVTQTPMELFVGMLSSMNIWNLKTLKFL